MVSRIEKYKSLEKVELFSCCNSSTLDKIVDLFEVIDYPADFTIFNKGDEGDYLYVIVSGKAKVHYGIHLIAELTESSTFGEHALINKGDRRSASVSTISDLIALRLKSDDFFTIVNIDQEVFRSLLHILVKRLNEQNELLIKKLERNEAELLIQVNKRTEEILAINEELKEQKLNIYFQNLTLENKGKEIQEQNKIIEDAYREIQDSINYAQHIQRSLFGSEEEIKYKAKENSINDSFIFFSPKDVVSGDFYWYSSDIGNKVFFIAADCTGHGIPAAFVTIIGTLLLNEIILNNLETNPSNILHKLDLLLHKTINSQNNLAFSTDGMDIAIICYDKIKNSIAYSGAKNPLYLVRNNELVEFKASKYTIGGKHPREQKEFITIDIEVKNNDKFYIFSDGFQDQLGEESNRKFMKKNFRNMLIESSKIGLSSQKEIFIKKFNDWKGKREQNDDVLLIGFSF